MYRYTVDFNESGNIAITIEIGHLTQQFHQLFVTIEEVLSKRMVAVEEPFVTSVRKAVYAMSILTEQTGKLVGPGRQQEVVGIQHVLKNRHFLLLWMAQLISQTILNAANFALVALVSARPDGALMASLAIIAFILPAVPFSAVAGVIVDKLDKRLVLWVSNLLRLGTMLLMFCWLLYDSSNVWPLFGFRFLTSLLGQFFIPAEGAAIPLLVGERELIPALSLFNITMTLAQA